jgi:hypothetical protein
MVENRPHPPQKILSIKKFKKRVKIKVEQPLVGIGLLFEDSLYTGCPKKK